MAEPSFEMESDQDSDLTMNNRDSKIPVCNYFEKDVEKSVSQGRYLLSIKINNNRNNFRENFRYNSTRPNLT